MKYLAITIFLFGALQLASCGKSDEQVAKEHADSLMAIRKGIYDVAASALRKQLKVPSTAKIAAVTDENTDTASLFIKGDTAIVRGEYDAQNSFGTFMHDKYEVHVTRVGGKWVVLYPDYSWLGVNAKYYGNVQDDPYGKVASPSATTAPPPPPPPPPADTSMRMR